MNNTENKLLFHLCTILIWLSFTVLHLSQISNLKHTSIYSKEMNMQVTIQWKTTENTHLTRQIFYQVVIANRHNTTWSKISSAWRISTKTKLMFNFTGSLLTTESYSPTSWMTGMLLETQKYIDWIQVNKFTIHRTLTGKARL